jgi:hypothetical protein
LACCSRPKRFFGLLQQAKNRAKASLDRAKTTNKVALEAEKEKDAAQKSK